MDDLFILNKLYPLQDEVLSIFASIETNFHLTGGTALSRGYLSHRYSDDLGFFVNDDPRFGLWADRAIHALSQNILWDIQVLQREERFVRLNLNRLEIDLKIDLINDVPSRIGQPWKHPVLGLLDTAENILANKITAVIDRTAPKDLADIWGLCYKMNLSLRDAISGAQGKAAGIFPLDLARVLCSATRIDWELVRWIEPPNPALYLDQLNLLGKSLMIDRG